MLACVLALSLGPPVEIDVRGLEAPLASTALPGQVLERVLEAGFPLHPGAATRVELRSEDEAVVVVVHTPNERWEERVATGGREPAVIGLDVAHRVVARLSEQTAVEPPPGTELPTAPAVQLDPSLLDGELRRALLLALVERGTPVAPEGQGAPFTACGAHDDDGTRVALGDDAEACDEALARATPHEALDQALDQAWMRALWPQDSDEEEDDDASSAVEPEPTPTTPPAPEAPSAGPAETGRRPRPTGPLETLVAVEAGPSVRPQIDGRAGGTVAVGRLRGLAGVFQLVVVPARGEADLRVVDVLPAIGLAWRVPLAARWRLVPGLVAGARIHTYRFPDEAPRAGVDPHLALPVRVQWRPHPRLSVGLRVAAAFDGRARRHRINGLEAWHRGPWRLDLGLELGVAFGRTAARSSSPSTSR